MCMFIYYADEPYSYMGCHRNGVLNDSYRQTSNISRTLVGKKNVDHSDVVNYIFILDLTPGFNGLGKGNSKTRRETLKVSGFVAHHIRGLTVYACPGLDVLRATGLRRHDNYMNPGYFTLAAIDLKP